MEDAVREQMARRILELEKERDALAAHLCSVQSAFDKVVSYDQFDNGTTNVILSVLRNVQAALDGDPWACLARRDARVAAEALDLHAKNIERLDGLTSADRMAKEARSAAYRIRRQAEETP